MVPRTTIITVTFAILALLATPADATIVAEWHAQEYSLHFIPTQNAPPGATGLMTLKLVNGETILHFRVRGLYPDTVYTIWTVFNILEGPGKQPSYFFTPAQMRTFYDELDTNGNHKVPSIGASPSERETPGFPAEGNGVSPTAKLGSGFTNGMGLDPGGTFLTNSNGDGEIRVTLDFDLINEAPVSSKDMIVQCVPIQGSATIIGADGNPRTVCADPTSKMMRVTTTFLRRYIGEYKGADWAETSALRARECENYDPAYDGDNVGYDKGAALGADARFWQCVEPASATGRHGGLPRVYRYRFDHFRIANHPDDLTHGFIGGNSEDHWIDMVGRRADLVSTGHTISSGSENSQRDRGTTRQ